MVARLADDVVGPDDAVLPLQEQLEVGERQPEQGEEHLRRQRHRELLGEVALAALDEAVDEVVDQRGDGLVERGHLPRREERVEDLAVLQVVGRVDLQRDERAHRSHGQRVDRRRRREHVGAAEGLHRRFLGGEHVAHAVEADDRRGGAERAVHLLRVAVELGIGGEERDAFWSSRF